MLQHIANYSKTSGKRGERVEKEGGAEGLD